MENKKSRFLSAAHVLPQHIYTTLCTLPSDISDSVHEITLQVNRPLSIHTNTKRYYFTVNGCVTDALIDNQMVTATSRVVFDTFQNICNYSVYSKQAEINNGYVTLRGGHRAGICGTAVLSEGKIVNIRDITSINIRISREIVGCSDELYRQVDFTHGVLICGAPCSGKTTIIRDLARRLSHDYKVSLIDERGELASSVGGVFQNDIGFCDVFDGYLKSEAIIHAVRSMSPHIIVCDEISTHKDVDAVISALNSGCSFVATIHADSVGTLLNKQIACDLLSTKAFEKVVFLDSRKNAGKILSIVKADELTGETYV